MDNTANYKETRDMVMEIFESMFKKTIGKEYVIQPHVSAETLSLNIRRQSRILFNKTLVMLGEKDKSILDFTVRDLQEVYNEHAQEILDNEMKNIIEAI